MRYSTSGNSSALWRIASAALLGGAIAASGTVSAFAAESVGVSAKIRNIVNGSVGERRLAVTDPVFEGEIVNAVALSHGELLLNDNSKIIVGENSSVTLDSFVVGSGGFTSGTIKVAKGAFRFISGNSPKGAFTVTTPVSTIGARGTEFDVYVAPNGVTRVVLFSGAVDVCSGGTCESVEASCDAVEVGANGSIGRIPYLNSPQASTLTQVALFSLAFNQQRFQEGWRVGTQVCADRASTDRRGFRPLSVEPGEPPDLPAERYEGYEGD